MTEYSRGNTLHERIILIKNERISVQKMEGLKKTDTAHFDKQLISTSFYYVAKLLFN